MLCKHKCSDLAQSFWREDLHSTFLPPSCHGTILKNETRKPSEAGLDHLSFGFQMTSLNEPFLSFSQSFGARLWCQELSFYISDGSYYIVYKESDGVCFCGAVFFQGVQAKETWSISLFWCTHKILLTPEFFIRIFYGLILSDYVQYQLGWNLLLLI